MYHQTIQKDTRNSALTDNILSFVSLSVAAMAVFKIKMRGLMALRHSPFNLVAMVTEVLHGTKFLEQIWLSLMQLTFLRF